MAGSPLHMLLNGMAVKTPLPQKFVCQKPVAGCVRAWKQIHARHQRAIPFLSCLMQDRFSRRCSKRCCSRQGCAYHPTVAMASPIARKSTNTAESIVKTECHGLLLNLYIYTRLSSSRARPHSEDTEHEAGVMHISHKQVLSMQCWSMLKA